MCVLILRIALPPMSLLVTFRLEIAPYSSRVFPSLSEMYAEVEGGGGWFGLPGNPDNRGEMV